MRAGKVTLTEADVARFMSKVNKCGPVMPHMRTKCHIWTGTTGEAGYGHFALKSVALLAHRVAFEIRWTKKPERWVLHRCDNPSCVRPEHLYEGTPCDNVRDMDQRGRRRPLLGELHQNAKLSDAEVAEVRLLYKKGDVTQDELARAFGVTQTVISRIVRGKRKVLPHVLFY